MSFFVFWKAAPHNCFWLRHHGYKCTPHPLEHIDTLPENHNYCFWVLIWKAPFIYITNQYRYEMLWKFGNQLNMKHQLTKFLTIGQNKTKCKVNLEIKGKTISIMAELFFLVLVNGCCCVKLSAGLSSATYRIKINKTGFLIC